MDALVSALVALVVAGVTAAVSIRLQNDRLRTELRTQFMAEEAIRELLQHPEWELRSFEAIQRRVGGFSDDDLRQLLVRAGALRFYSDQRELWGLRQRNGELLDGKNRTQQHIPSAGKPTSADPRPGGVDE